MLLFSISSSISSAATNSGICDYSSGEYDAFGCEDKEKGFGYVSSIFQFLGVLFGAIGAVSIIYKIGVDIISIGVYRGTNGSEASDTTLVEESLHSKHISKPSKIDHSEGGGKSQASCPECARKIRWPSDYVGEVGCPGCSIRFDVTSLAISKTEATIEDGEWEMENGKWRFKWKMVNENAHQLATPPNSSTQGNLPVRMGMDWYKDRGGQKWHRPSGSAIDWEKQ